MEQAVSWQGLLGYLNFSEGKPDPRFQKQFNDAYAFLANQGAAEPCPVLYELLTSRLADLGSAGASGFSDVRQAEAVLGLIFTRVLPAYRRHHADLLFHLSDPELFQPFFLARVVEAVLAQGPPWNENERLIAGA